MEKEQQVTQKLYICQPNIILFYLAGLAVVQIPEFDMSVAHGYEVGAVLGEGHACHLTGHLVGSHHHILLWANAFRCLKNPRAWSNISTTCEHCRLNCTFQAHTLTIMLCWFPTLTMYLPLGEKATHEMPKSCIWSSATCLRSDTSHSRTAGRWPHWGDRTAVWVKRGELIVK